MVFVAAIVLSIGLAIFGGYLFCQYRYVRSFVPHPIPGERLPDIPFANGEDRPIDLRGQGSNPLLLFLFERPCYTCTKNIAFWSKLNELARGKARVLGVIQSRTKMLEIAETGRMPFALIAPLDSEEFIQEWPVRLNMPQTCIIQGNRVQWIRLGDLKREDMRGIIKKLSELGG